MNVQQKRRELFESTTTLPTGVEWNSDSKSYVGPNYWLAEYAWDALNKALDAVEIELPESVQCGDEQYHSWEGMCAEGVRQSIEETGLGLRVKS